MLSTHVSVMISECAVHDAMLSFAGLFKHKIITSDLNPTAVKSVFNKDIICYNLLWSNAVYINYILCLENTVRPIGSPQAENFSIKDILRPNPECL